MANTTFVQSMEETMHQAITSHIKKLAEEITKEAVAKLTKEIESSIDKIALNLCQEYRLEDHSTHIAIHVKKKL